MVIKAGVCRSTLCIPPYLVWAETHYMFDLIACLFSYIDWLSVARDAQTRCPDVPITFFSLSLILGSSD